MMSNMKRKIHEAMGCSIKKLSITSEKGLWLTFGNGYSLSIQIGEANYCHPTKLATGIESPDCEMAIIGPNGDLLTWPESEYDTVGGYIHTSEIPTWIQYVSNL
jgi:hypothetical protein